MTTVRSLSDDGQTLTYSHKWVDKTGSKQVLSSQVPLSLSLSLSLCHLSLPPVSASYLCRPPVSATCLCHLSLPPVSVPTGPLRDFHRSRWPRATRSSSIASPTLLTRSVSSRWCQTRLCRRRHRPAVTLYARARACGHVRASMSIRVRTSARAHACVYLCARVC